MIFGNRRIGVDVNGMFRAKLVAVVHEIGNFLRAIWLIGGGLKGIELAIPEIFLSMKVI